MYVINGIPEFRKNRYRNSDFRLERFSGFPICFSAGKFRNSELGSGIPNSGSPRKRNPKTEFPTKLIDQLHIEISNTVLRGRVNEISQEDQ